MNKSAESDAMLMMPDQQDYLVAKIHKTLTRHDDPTLEEQSDKPVVYNSRRNKHITNEGFHEAIARKYNSDNTMRL